MNHDHHHEAPRRPRAPSAPVSGEPSRGLACCACGLTFTGSQRYCWITRDLRVWCSSCVSAPNLLPPRGQGTVVAVGPPPAARVVFGGSRASVATYLAEQAAGRG